MGDVRTLFLQCSHPDQATRRSSRCCCHPLPGDLSHSNANFAPAWWSLFSPSTRSMYTPRYGGFALSAYEAKACPLSADLLLDIKQESSESRRIWSVSVAMLAVGGTPDAHTWRERCQRSSRRLVTGTQDEMVLHTAVKQVWPRSDAYEVKLAWNRSAKRAPPSLGCRQASAHHSLQFCLLNSAF